MSEHTKEPWEYTVWNDGTVSVTNNDQDTIAKLEDLFKCGDAITNARRIVTCVNALEGIPTETIENDDWDNIISSTIINEKNAIIESLKSRFEDEKSLADELADRLDSMLKKAYKQNWNDNYPEEVEASEELLAKHREMRGK